jgi:hypothetical protein
MPHLHPRSAFVVIPSLLVLLLSVAIGQQGDGDGNGTPRGNFYRWRAPSGLAVLLSSSEVQRELSLSSEQNELVQLLFQDISNQRRAVFQPSSLEAGDENDRGTRWERLRRMEEHSERLFGTVLNTDQAKRLSQLRVQWDGLRALGRPDFAEQLELSQEQLQQIYQICEIRQADREALDNPLRRIRRSRLEELRDPILAVLTEQQRNRWKELEGAKFAFPAELLRERRRGGFRRP